jgi:pimeloyl-ACP methyl ester carboxylesterase
MSSPRPHILVIHGALGSAAQMQPIADGLASLGEPVLVELPGHGETPLEPGASYSIASFADALALKVARLREAAPDAGPPVVFGYSMGGYVALALEAREPGSLAAVLTLGTKFEWTPEIAEREASRLDPERMRAKVPQFAATLEERHAGAGGWTGTLEATAVFLRRLGERPLLNEPELRSIAARVRVGVGDRDVTVGVDESLRVSRQLSHGSLAVLPNTPHPLEQVDSALLASVIRKAIGE